MLFQPESGSALGGGDRREKLGDDIVVSNSSNHETSQNEGQHWAEETGEEKCI